MATDKHSLATELSLLGVLALLWGSSYLLTKIAVATIPPLTLIAVRVLIAAIVLASVMAFQGHRLPRDGRSWRMLLVQALFNSIVSWTLLAWGQQFIDSGLASVLNSTSPIFVFFITLLVTRHESVSALKLCGAILGVAGVTLIVGVDALRGVGQQVAGQLAALAGAMLYGMAAIYGKRFAHLPAVTTAAGTMIWASVVLVLSSLLIEWPLERAPTMASVLAACGLGVFSTGLALLIYFRLVRTLGSMGVASQSYLRAGVGVVLGILILGEEISLMVGLGLIAAICGVAAINVRLPVRRVDVGT
jgi:drug/metabolite transporter (DMT)-like permease